MINIPTRRAMGRRLFSNSYRKDENKVNISKANTVLHETLKCITAYIITKKSGWFITEGYFEHGGRCDVWDNVNHIIYEIVNTEKERSLELKKEKYPKYDIYCIYCKDYKNLTIDEIYDRLNKIII